MSQDSNQNMTFGVEGVPTVLVGLGYNNSDLRREVALSIVRIIKTKGLNISQIILTGGSPGGAEISEAEDMNRFVQKYCSDIEVILESTSINTKENASNVSKILGGSTKVVLVGESSHIPRARGNFEEAGIQIHSSFSSREVLKDIVSKPKKITKRHLSRRIQEELGGIKFIVPQGVVDFLKRKFLK